MGGRILQNVIFISAFQKRVIKILCVTKYIDEIKPKLHIPILLLHECQITASTTEMSDEYKNSIISFHRDRAHSFFKKQINKLSSVHKYSEINFHLILFPVPDKTKIVNWFISQAKNLKNDADE